MDSILEDPVFLKLISELELLTLFATLLYLAYLVLVDARRRPPRSSGRDSSEWDLPEGDSGYSFRSIDINAGGCVSLRSSGRTLLSCATSFEKLDRVHDMNRLSRLVRSLFAVGGLISVPKRSLSSQRIQRIGA